MCNSFSHSLVVVVFLHYFVLAKLAISSKRFKHERVKQGCMYLTCIAWSSTLLKTLGSE